MITSKTMKVKIPSSVDRKKTRKKTRDTIHLFSLLSETKDLCSHDILRRFALQDDAPMRVTSS